MPVFTTLSGIKLNQNYFWYFDISEEFKLFVNGAIDTSNMNDILKYLNLKEVPTESQCQVNSPLILVLLQEHREADKYPDPERVQIHPAEDPEHKPDSSDFQTASAPGPPQTHSPTFLQITACSSHARWDQVYQAQRTPL